MVMVPSHRHNAYFQPNFQHTLVVFTGFKPHWLGVCCPGGGIPTGSTGAISAGSSYRDRETEPGTETRSQYTPIHSFSGGPRTENPVSNSASLASTSLLREAASGEQFCRHTVATQLLCYGFCHRVHPFLLTNQSSERRDAGQG